MRNTRFAKFLTLGMVRRFKNKGLIQRDTCSEWVAELDLHQEVSKAARLNPDGLRTLIRPSSLRYEHP